MSQLKKGLSNIYVVFKDYAQMNINALIGSFIVIKITFFNDLFLLGCGKFFIKAEEIIQLFSFQTVCFVDGLIKSRVLDVPP